MLVNFIKRKCFDPSVKNNKNLKMDEVLDDFRTQSSKLIEL